MWTDSQVKGKILHKLTRKGKFEHSHTALDNLQKGFPSEMKGRVKDTAQDFNQGRNITSEKDRLW